MHLHEALRPSVLVNKEWLSRGGTARGVSRLIISGLGTGVSRVLPDCDDSRRASRGNIPILSQIERRSTISYGKGTSSTRADIGYPRRGFEPLRWAVNRGAQFLRQDHRVRDAADFDVHRAYIYQNPVKRGLVQTRADYRYCSAYPGFRLDDWP
jgi:hypothetical protein